MTSKLSVHVNQKPSGFGDLLQKCNDAHSPIGIVYSVNINIRADIIAHSPSTKWVYRRQTDQFNRQPDHFFKGDPVVSCESWFNTPDVADNNRTLFQNWELNPADYFDALNEVVPDTKDKAIWLNAWYVHALSICTPRGFKLALCSTPTGSPPIEMWRYLIPCLQVGKNNNAILNLHSYWNDAIDQDNALRYRQVWNVLPASARIPIIISEASSGNGYATTYSGQAWVDNMAAYDKELMKDSYLLGACGYQLGGQESNMKDAVGIYGDYIASTNVFVPPPPPPTPKHYLTSKVSNLHVRTAPNTADASNVIGSMALGVSVEVDATPINTNGYWWYKVISPEQYAGAYVAQQSVPQVLAEISVK